MLEEMEKKNNKTLQMIQQEKRVAKDNLVILDQETYS